MSASDPSETPREWIRFARQDLAAASVVDLAPIIRCYHAQQAAEKALKAALIIDGIEVPRTHDLNRIRMLLADESLAQQTEKELERLTRWATNERYPGAIRDPSAAEADQALRFATSIVDAARAYVERASA